MAKRKKTGKMVPKGPLEWIYICEGKSMKDLYEILKEEESFVTEYWEDAAVIEVSLSEIGNIDIEESEEEAVYWVTLSSKGYDQAIDAMKRIEEICGGQFSVDESLDGGNSCQ